LRWIAKEDSAGLGKGHDAGKECEHGDAGEPGDGEHGALKDYCKDFDEA
jgi:hypothetical protein